MKNDEVLDWIPIDENGAKICEKIDEFYKNNDVVGCIKFLVEETGCDENAAMHIYLILTGQEEVDYGLSPQQIAYNNQVAREWQNKPKCPTCGSTNLSKITVTKRAVKVGLFGIFGAIDDAGKTYKCDSCGCKF